jgi:membrane protein YqaA with SNARE-associated domain
MYRSLSAQRLSERTVETTSSDNQHEFLFVLSNSPVLPTKIFTQVSGYPQANYGPVISVGVVSRLNYGRPRNKEILVLIDYTRLVQKKTELFK